MFGQAMTHSMAVSFRLFRLVPEFLNNVYCQSGLGGQFTYVRYLFQTFEKFDLGQ